MRQYSILIPTFREQSALGMFEQQCLSICGGFLIAGECRARSAEQPQVMLREYRVLGEGPAIQALLDAAKLIFHDAEILACDLGEAWFAE